MNELMYKMFVKKFIQNVFECKVPYQSNELKYNFEINNCAFDKTNEIFKLKIDDEFYENCLPFLHDKQNWNDTLKKFIFEDVQEKYSIEFNDKLIVIKMNKK